ncbi:MFS transporter [Pseudoalteromonas sp. SG41-2]|uniref:MFS transporter n=1 Tax=unclassified Pseudoalteromonas TaxID=194690 RepID=UPI0016005611|nr:MULTISPECIES: MFS transporter [unclassified Pseudoalteromonas]MBB1432937.1 MFS transporter [Pseudoalteromonas sp. SG43-6]MBB1480101.1 MFS transporter [Pseudoalteromonas sp. SG41-2]
MNNNQIPITTNSAAKQSKQTPANKGFGVAFYIANTMEIFERLAWYGFFAVSSVYMTTPVEQGGVGFNDAQRGAVQGIIPFFLYLLPVLTGALADRYGYKRLFIISFIIMAPGYYFLGQVTDFNSFFMILMLVAFGAACFKPVVVGTISRSTNDTNRGLGFGIFYTMVNLGGFIGPLVAGYMRAISWDAVFVMSAVWILLNFIPLLFYRETTPSSQANTSLKQVLQQAQQVLGNSRFALLLFTCVIILMTAGVSWLSYTQAFVLIALWLGTNWLWDKSVSTKQSHNWHLQPVRVSNRNFALYLAILTGFWTVYNQLFYTLPLFIRDYTNTQDLVVLLSCFGQSTVDFFAFVDSGALSEKIQLLSVNYASSSPLASTELEAIRLELVHLKVNVPVSEIALFIEQIATSDFTLQQSKQLAQQWLVYRQVNPEYLINLDFAAIVLLQIIVSVKCQRFKVISVLISGLIVTAGAFLVLLLMSAGLLMTQLGGAVMITVILLIALGEMLTSPKSQEYVASIAPKDSAAMFMGYYFVSMALGFLFAGFLSGWSYGYLVKELQRPALMWLLFAMIALFTGFGFYLLARNNKDTHSET